MSNMMKSYWMESNGETATIDLREVATPLPAANQLLVKMHAASLNRGEFIVGHGLHKAGAAKPIGTDGAGVVEAIGSDVTGFKVGDRVMGRCAGAFSEMALMSTAEAMHIPANLDWEAAASVPLTGHVVFDMLVLQGRLVAGEWLLINGVSSGVGVAALQMAKAIGAKVIGTSGSADKLARLKALGLDVAICTREANFHDEVMTVTGGKGVNLVINTVGGSVFSEDVRCMAFEGRLAMVGYVDGQLQTDLSIEALHAKRLTLFGVSNKLRSPEQRASGVPRFRAEVLPMLASGSITPLVDKVFAFEELPAAKACMDASEHLGKIVLKIA
jgi:NADPH:quinone reductase-like Zn-dependent oxidoreductase